METRPQVSLILPAYNEAQRIRATVSQAQTYFVSRGIPYDIIVSADGNDGTREIVADMMKTDSCLRVIGSNERHGKGYGIRQAVPLATGQIIGFADADNKTPIEEFDKFLPHLQAGIDVVIGSRGLEGSVIEQKQPLLRQLGSRGFKIFMHLMVGLHDIVDTQCGFKFFQREVARTLFSRQVIDGYMYDVEILYLARQYRYTLEQIPIRWRDDNDSRLQLLSGTIDNVKDIWHIRQSKTFRPSIANTPITIQSSGKK